MPSPPPPYNYAHVPVVQGRSALWARTPDRPVVTGLGTEHREVLVTTLLEAEPDHRHEHPAGTPWPLAMAVAIAILLVTVLFTPWGLPIGVVLAFIAFAGWALPRGKPATRERQVVEIVP